MDNQIGVKDLQDYVFTNVYQEALKNERHQISMQVFRMILCGIPRTGKTTFWKRLAKVKGFQPSENSPSTSAFEAHMISANEKKESDAMSPHLESAMLFDLHLYEDSEDLRKEALTIYKHIIMTKKPKSATKDSAQMKTALALPPPTQAKIADEGTESVDEGSNVAGEEAKNANEESEVADEGTKIADEGAKSANEGAENTDETTSNTEKALSPISLTGPAMSNQHDPISLEIEKYFDELHTLLKSGENLPEIPLIKKICSLADIGGQRAFLEMLPTVTIGKALYLLFFSYENFEMKLSETVQMKANPMEVCTGTRYKQMEVILQSLICVSTTSKVSSNNVALLVGTHVDKVEPKYVDHVNGIIYKNVKPFLDNETLVLAKKNELVLEASTQPNSRCSENPEDYQEVIMNHVENRLKCSESEKLPASWYMFNILLRRIQLAGHSVLQYHHCELIAEKLHIKKMQLQSLLSRMHKILGVVIYFPEVEQLKDIVICDPAVVYKSISELIFNSFDEASHPKLSLRLKKWGVFLTKELKEQCKAQDGCQLQLDKLIILLQHQGIIAPVNVLKSVETETPSAEPEHQDNAEQHRVHPQYLIPCMVNDAKQADLCVHIQKAQMSPIIPLRVNFSCGFAPMGGFCYLFTKLLTNNRDKGWQLLLPDIFDETTKNDIYWRNKVTFKVDNNYFVTLLSTHEYYEIHIIISQPEESFNLASIGHHICQKVWNAVENVLTKSLNQPLQHYNTACECTIHRNDEDYDGHIMTFSHNPDECKPSLTASCLKDKVTVKVDDTKLSAVVWFKEPRICHTIDLSKAVNLSIVKEPHLCPTTDLGKPVDLSIDLIFKVKASDEKLRYEWWFDDEEIEADDERYSISDTGVLSIQEFEKDYEGEYRCIVSTTNQPVMSVSTQVQLNLTAPPDIFDPKMRRNKFSLFLNANGIPYEDCKLLKGLNITAAKFNLRSYELWSHKLQLTWDDPVLKNFVALCHCPPHTGLTIKYRLPSSAEISWKPLPKGEQNIVTGYAVQVVGPDPQRDISVTDASATSVKISQLKSCTSYTFHVSAVTELGNGPVATVRLTTPKEETATSDQCPVCRSIHVNPCTLQCGHTTCQLCLAKMWKHGDTTCPMCKEPWQVLPAITIGLRDNIENTHGDEVAQLKSQYSEDDKEVIKKFLVAKESLKHETNMQELNGQMSSDQVLPGLQIMEHPQSNARIKYRESITLSVSATGAENLSYNWKKDGEIITSSNYTGFDLPTLTINNFTHDDQGKYSCIIKNCNRSIESQPAELMLDLQILKHPKSVACDYHAQVSLSVSAIGAGPLSYKWKRNGVDIVDQDCIGVNEPTLNIGSFILEHEGEYSCEVEHNEMSIGSNIAKLELNPYIINQPRGIMIARLGESITLCVSAVGSGQLSYKWKKDGQEISDDASCTGTDAASLSIASFSEEQQGLYTCIVKNHITSVESSPGKLKLKLEMRSDPQTSTTIKHGEDVTLTVSAVGPQPLSYKWTKDGEAISDANCNGTDKDKLTITSFSSANQGCYLCTVNDDEQYVESMPALLGLDLQILDQPQTKILCVYQAKVHLSVSAVGYGPLSYEWKKDGKEITSAATEFTGVDTNALTIISFSSSHQGSYVCLIHDRHKSTITEPTNLALSLQITKQPQESSIVSYGESVTLHVSAVGLGHLHYKWKRDGQDIIDSNCAGIDTSDVTINSFSEMNQGDYACIVMNDNTSVLSNFAKLELKLQINDHPQGCTSIKHGDNVTLAVSANGPQPLTYQWMKDGEEVSDVQVDKKLAITSFSNQDQGNYTCRVSGGQQSIESTPALLGLDLQILQQTQGNIFCKYGDKVVLSVSAVGRGTLSYKWEKDEKDILHTECTGIKSHTLTITNFLSMHEGSYLCIVKDNHKSLKSECAKLALNLIILSQPQSNWACEDHASVSLSVSAIGAGILNYKWKKDGKDVTQDPGCIGVDTAILTIISFSSVHVGKYTCAVKDSHRTLESNSAELHLASSAKSVPTKDPIFGKMLSLRELTALKYTEKGEGKRVAIISKACHKWKDILSLICDDPNKSRTLTEQNPSECLRQVFIDYFINKKPPDYSQDWNGLIDLLKDVELDALAKEIDHALSCIAQPTTA